MDKDTKQILIWLAVWTVLTWICAQVGEGIGLTLWITGTALMLMYAWADYRIEQARKRERRKVREGAERIERAYKEDAE